MYNYYINSKKTVVKSIHELLQRSYSYFGITALAESGCRTCNKRNHFFLLLYLSSIFFSLPARHTQSTYQFPIWEPSPRIVSSRPAPRYIRQKRRETRWREEASQSHQRSTKSPLFSYSAIFRERRLRSAWPFARFCTPGRPGKHVNRRRE